MNESLRTGRRLAFSLSFLLWNEDRASSLSKQKKKKKKKNLSPWWPPSLPLLLACDQQKKKRKKRVLECLWSRGVFSSFLSTFFFFFFFLFLVLGFLITGVSCYEAFSSSPLVFAWTTCSSSSSWKFFFFLSSNSTNKTSSRSWLQFLSWRTGRSSRWRRLKPPFSLPRLSASISLSAFLFLARFLRSYDQEN